MFLCSMDSTSKKPGVTGIGGVFFKSTDPERLNAWYKEQLGIDITQWGAKLSWGVGTDEPGPGSTTFSIFKQESTYYPGAFMINFRVAKLDELVEQMRVAGVKMEEKVESYDYGKFAWVYDPDGNKVELWEPIDSGCDSAQ